MERRSRTLGRRWVRAALGVAVTTFVAAAYATLRDTPTPTTVEGQTLTWRFHLRGPLAAPPGVAIVAIDDKTIAAFKRWPLPRRAIAEAIERLRTAGARSVGLDLMFVERESPPAGGALGPGDLSLRDGLAAGPPAALALAATFGAERPDAATRERLDAAQFRVVRRAPNVSVDFLAGHGALMPIGPLADVAALAHVNVPVDADGTLRHLFLAIDIAGALIPAFSLEVARLREGIARGELVLLFGSGVRLGERTIETDARMRMALDYYGPAGSIATYSLIDVVEDRIPASAFAGRAVVIGATAVGVGDTFATPFSEALPGVEVLATGVANIAIGSPLLRDWRVGVADLTAVVALGIAGFAAASLPASGVAAIAVLAMMLGWGALASWAFVHAGWWLSIVFPSASIALNAFAGVVARVAAERRLRRRVEHERANLARYFSPILADAMAASERPSFEGSEQMAAILFVDIAGFTRRSQALGPAATVEFLRDFHARIEAAVLAHGGALERFTGDGAMVIFGIPTARAEDSAAALACALRLEREIADWSRDLAARGLPSLDIGIGIHYGEVVIARLGGATQKQLTAAGDTVNLASRLEALTRAHDATIAISDAAATAVRAAGRAELLDGFNALPPLAVRGREGEMIVWVRGRGGRLQERPGR